MQVVLLKNCTRQLMPLNVGDKSVTVKRQQIAQTKSGQVGTKHTEHQVSSSITLPPGKWVRVPGEVLKQRSVQRMLAARPPMLKMVEQKSDVPAPAPAKVVIEASAPLKSAEGSHPVVEEGTVAIAEVLASKKKSKRTKKTETEG